MSLPSVRVLKHHGSQLWVPQLFSLYWHRDNRLVAGEDELVLKRCATGASRVESLLPFQDEKEHLQPSNSDFYLEDDGSMENEKPFNIKELFLPMQKLF
jgi:hypothetical protein